MSYRISSVSATAAAWLLLMTQHTLLTQELLGGVNDDELSHRFHHLASHAMALLTSGHGSGRVLEEVPAYKENFWLNGPFALETLALAIATQLATDEADELAAGYNGVIDSLARTHALALGPATLDEKASAGVGLIEQLGHSHQANGIEVANLVVSWLSGPIAEKALQLSEGNWTPPNLIHACLYLITEIRLRASDEQMPGAMEVIEVLEIALRNELTA